MGNLAAMAHSFITVIPVYNGERFLQQTLDSIALQTRRPDRLIVLDNCSTDATPEIVQKFQGFPCEYVRNPANLGLFGNCNLGLRYARETEFLHFLCADDLVTPNFCETMSRELEDCVGLGLVYSQDERIDENNRRLSMSGKVSGGSEIIPVDAFLARKAEISNQAFSGSVLKTSHRESPAQFRLDMAILADVAFWADWGRHCQKIVQVNQPLCQYRWHGDNTTNKVMPGIQALILDEWRVMRMNEKLRAREPGAIRRFKLKGLFAVRTGIKAKRIRQLGDRGYSQQIINEGRNISGPLAWTMGRMVVEARDAWVYGLLRRPRHPKNVYS